MEKLAEILADVLEEEVDVANVTLESDLFEDLGLNSIGILYVAMAIEEEFDMKFQNEDMLEIKTVGDVVKFIETEE
jgi:acyl carrier protein